MIGRRGSDVLDRILMVLVNLLGIVAFLSPFFMAEVPTRTERFARAGDAPLLFAAFAGLLIAVAATAVRAGRIDTKRLALLGLLAGINAVLRLPGAFGGGSLMFFLPIMAGFVYGPGFGFMLGSSSFAVSAVITGGVGPWLPFQMWALGWVGGGAGLLRRPLARANIRVALVVLAAYGWGAGLVFGALTNLWFWPFLGGSSDVSWAPGIGAGEALHRYWAFYLLTSLAWDAGRALLNAALVLGLGSPVLRLLGRFRSRLDVSWVPEEAPVEPAPSG